MTRDELQAIMSEYVTAEPERQGQIASSVMDEFDSMNSAMTDGVPEGSSNWREAYNNLRRDYVNRFMGRDNVPNDISGPNEEQSTVTDNGGPVSIADLFKSK